MSVLVALTLLGSAPGPFATIKQFVHAMNVGDLATIANLTLGGKKSILDRINADEAKIGGVDHWNVTASDPKVTIIGDSALVTATFNFHGSPDSLHRVQTITLKRVGDVWKVLPMGSYWAVSDIGKEAAIAAGRPKIPKNLPFRGTERLTRAKDLSWACETLVIDGNKRLDLAKSNTHAKLSPMLAHRESWLSPFTHRTGFEINPRLFGKKLTYTDAPGITIMVYEGSHGKVDFSHGGKAAVAFIDGHVELVSKKDLKSLLWK